MIEKMLFWNIRSVNTQNSLDRLMDLNRKNHYPFITLMEPFQAPSQIELYRIQIAFNYVGMNKSGKI